MSSGSTPPQTPQEGLAVEASVVTDRGCVRDHNEDSAVFVRPADQKRLDSKGVLALVADGMGGHQAGEIASEIAVEVIRRIYYRSPAAELSAALIEALGEANRAIYERATRDGHLAGMGTTCTAVAICRGRAHLAHVGDSRLYLLRDGELRQMSEDHSHVGELQRLGLLTAEEARNHMQRNVITRALGADPSVEVSTWGEPFELCRGDRLLLSTDGLYEPLGNEKICQLAAAGSVYEASNTLLEAAKQSGAPDNVSIILLEIVSADDDDPHEAAETRKVRALP